MKKLSILLVLSLTGAAWMTAAHHESGPKNIASVHDIMEDVVKPNMDALAAMRKAGGPQNEKEWKKAKSAASLVGEGVQLSLNGDRVKDDVWKSGGEKSVAGAIAAVSAAEAMDTDAWMAGVTAVGQGCRSCHKKHKPKKE